ncbi:MAG: HAD family phosphatase [Lachnospiraceae bacterium]|nr:HAD family phosphatase [Lachnospiraceae bacterium]
MIKVIASDMDGTLLNEKHIVSERTITAIKQAASHGIRFMIITGRTFKGALEGLGTADFTCDYIVSSGAEVRNSKQEIVFSGVLKNEACRKICEILDKYPAHALFCTDHLEYCLGTEDVLEKNILEHIKAFDETVPDSEIRNHPMYATLKEKTKRVDDYQELERLQIPISKIFVFSLNLEMLKELRKELEEIPQIVIASSGDNNLEITDVSAQKGPVLKNYIESLGYTMDEVMVLGDSMNDYSMFAMDFGATVAMENADPEIKKFAKYVTKSNAEDGVAYAIEKLLENL